MKRSVHQMKQHITKEYMKEIIPVFLGGIGMAIYYFTDGLFIGNALGDDGMSAITISWTIVMFLTAIATGIGMGGSIRYSIALGQNNGAARRDYFWGTVISLLFTSAALTLLLAIFYKDILRFLGADGTVLQYCEDYCFLVVYGVFFQLFGLGALPLVRNMGGYRLSSIAMGTGYLLNFVLDYLLMFRFPLGMFGCSVAYMSGQMAITVLCAAFFIKNYQKIIPSGQQKFFPSHTIPPIITTGIAPFGLFFSQNLVSAIVNRGFMAHGGSEALACYTVVIYIAGITNTLHRTLMDGSQPVMSRYHGNKDEKASRQAALLMYIFSAIIIGTGAVFTLLFKNQIASSFGVSETVIANVGKWLPFYLIGYACICYSRTTISYLSAIDKKWNAGILTYAEPASMSCMVLLLPLLLEENGVWAAIISVYISMAILATIMLIRKTEKAS